MTRCLAFLVALAALLAPGPARAAVPRTRVVGSITLPDGTSPTGTVRLTLTPSAAYYVNDDTSGSTGRHLIAQVPQKYSISNPASLDLYVIPNTGSGATPSGTTYAAVVECAQGTYRMTWQVPTSASSLRAADLLVTTASTGTTQYLPLTGGILTGTLDLNPATGAPLILRAITLPPTGNTTGAIARNVTDSYLWSWNGTAWVQETGGGGSGGVAWKEEGGASLGTATTIDVVGSLLTATFSGGVGTLTARAILNADVSASAAVDLSKLQTVSTDTILGRTSAGTGAIQQLTVTDFFQSLFDDATAGDARTTLGAAAAATTLTAGVGLSGGGDLSTNRTIDLEDTGVAAGTFGGPTQTVTVTFDAQGRATSAGVVTIAGVSPSAHASTHIDGGSDELSTVTGLPGLLPESQNVTASEEGTELGQVRTFNAAGTLITMSRVGSVATLTARAVLNADVDSSAAVDLSKLQTVSTDTILGRTSAGTGAIQQLTVTDFFQSLFDDSDAATFRTSIGAASTAHASTHATAGSDPVTVTGLAGFPGGGTTFLRDDGTFAAAGGAFSGDVSTGASQTYLSATSTTTPSVIIGDPAGLAIYPSAPQSATQCVTMTMASGSNTFDFLGKGAATNYRFRSAGFGTTLLSIENNGGTFSTISNNNFSFGTIQFSMSGGNHYLDGTGAYFGSATVPTARVDIRGSTTSIASLSIEPGTAPTSPNDGDVWNDSTQLCDRVRRAGINQAASNVIFTTTSDVTVTNTTTTTSVTGTSVGINSLGASGWAPGKRVTLITEAIISADAATPGSLTFDCTVNTTTAATSGAVTLPLTLSGERCRIAVTYTCRATGAAGRFVATGEAQFTDGSTDTLRTYPLQTVGEFNVNTTQATTFDNKVKWSVADPDNIFVAKTTVCTVEN